MYSLRMSFCSVPSSRQRDALLLGDGEVHRRSPPRAQSSSRSTRSRGTPGTGSPCRERVDRDALSADFAAGDASSLCDP
jgi:hypothetical protein